MTQKPSMTMREFFKSNLVCKKQMFTNFLLIKLMIVRKWAMKTRRIHAKIFNYKKRGK